MVDRQVEELDETPATGIHGGVHCASCGAAVDEEVEECPTCGVEHLSRSRLELLMTRAEMSNSRIERASLSLPPLGYHRVRAKRWLAINLLTLNYFIVGGFLIVPFHASKLIDRARHELLDYRKALVKAETDDRGQDEIFCRSCGSRIRVDVDVCPHCNDDNPVADVSAEAYGIHDPDEYETDVTDRWKYGIVGGFVLFSLFFVASRSTGFEFLYYLGFVAYLLTPVSAYFDMQYIRANARWNPWTFVWIPALLLPFFNVAVAIVYFFYRRQELRAV